MYPNRYPGNCAECLVRVPVNEGVIEKIDGRWITWCMEHKPTVEPLIKLYIQSTRPSTCLSPLVFSSKSRT
jgi:hypothetical protein